MNVFGTGPLRIYINDGSSNYILFPIAFVLISHMISSIRQLAINGYQLLTTQYYRPIYRCQIMICDYSDITSYVNLVNYINSDYTFTVVPSYDSSLTSNLSTLCYVLNLLISFKLLAPQPIGQIVLILFIAVNYVADMGI